MHLITVWLIENMSKTGFLLKFCYYLFFSNSKNYSFIAVYSLGILKLQVMCSKYTTGLVPAMAFITNELLKVFPKLTS
jgi:hypothetical protein